MHKIVLLKPLMTEKALKDKTIYVFQVAINSTKRLIKQAIEDLYEKVEVGTVRTTVHKGKVKTVGSKRKKKAQQDTKKAYITLIKGEIPDIKVQ